MTQKQIILAHLKDYGGWEYEFKLRAIETKYGWIGARGDRNVREMLASGELEGKFDRYEGKYRMVRYPQEKVLLPNVEINEAKPKTEYTYKLNKGTNKMEQVLL